MKIVVIDYGAGNVFSVKKALEKLGRQAIVSSEAEVIRMAERVIFPGVGQASAAMECIRKKGLDRVIPELKMPVLGICLGMQLMCRFTEEENTPGLAIFPEIVKKIEGNCKVPHMGWNKISDLKSGLFRGMEKEEWMYFVHSYYVPQGPDCIAACCYHTAFAAAIQRDNFYGCQFHPEKSAVAGEKILENFLTL